MTICSEGGRGRISGARAQQIRFRKLKTAGTNRLFS
jgi:hypothetical protein